MPLRHLMALHAETAGSEAQGVVGRIDGAIEFAKKVVASNAAYFAANPSVAVRLDKIAEQNRNYVAHEFFNRDWGPMHFAELAARLEPAKLSFAASANTLDQVDAINLTAAGQELLKGISHPVLQESVRDYLVNQQFRRDIFVKGLRRLSLLEQVERLREVRLALVSRPQDVEMKAKGALTEGNLQEAIYRPIIEALGEGNNAPKTVAELGTRSGIGGLHPAQLTQAIGILVGSGHVHPAQSEVSVKSERERCKRLNRCLCDRARSGAEGNYLASPILGGAVAATRFQQIFLLALANGKKQPEEWAQFAWDTLARQGQRIMKDGKPLESADSNRDELLRQAREFSERRLPILRTLDVA